MARRFSAPHLPTSARRQRGAALLAAMVIVTIVVTIASSMVWQQWRAVQVESAERSVAQSQWILRGALDWGRLILREDNRTVDHLGEPWAVPLAEARISSFLAADQADNVDAGPEAFLSGQIYDVSARFNLMALVDPATGDIDQAQLQVLERLCEYLSMSTSVADQIAQAWRRAWLARASDDPKMLEKLGGEAGRQRAPLMAQTVDQITWLGVDAGVAERLRPYVTLIDDQVPVNVNTASREVLAAVLNVDLGRADRLVQYRQRNPFKDVGEISNVLGNTPALTGNGTSVTSSYFEVTGRLRLEDSVMQKRYLVKRNGQDIAVQFETSVSGKDMQTAPGAP